MEKLATWKKTQKKNQKRKVTAKAHLAHKRLMGKNRIKRFITPAKPVVAKRKANLGIFNWIMNLLTGKKNKES